VRRSSLNVAARFARPVEICARLVLGLRFLRRSYPKALAACGTLPLSRTPTLLLCALP